MSRFLLIGFISLFILGSPSGALKAQDDEQPRMKVLDVKGFVSVFRDETDETSRLHTGQSVDDGDQVTTGHGSEAVFRLSGRAYIHLAQDTKFQISRLRYIEPRKLLCRLHLIEGRMITMLDKSPKFPFEVTAGPVSCRIHGKLFEFIRQKDQVRILSHEGAVVAGSHGKVEMGKKGQVMVYVNGRFKDKYLFPVEDEADMEEWREHLHSIRTRRHK